MKANKITWARNGAIVALVIVFVRMLGADVQQNEAFNFGRIAGALLFGAAWGWFAAFCHDFIYVHYRGGKFGNIITSVKLRVATAVFASWAVAIFIMILIKTLMRG